MMYCDLRVNNSHNFLMCISHLTVYSNFPIAVVGGSKTSINSSAPGLSFRTTVV